MWLLLGRAIKPRFDTVYPLSEAATAHAHGERNSHIGKIVLQS